jgi:pyruvate formate lyase activating enzyme
VLPELTTSASDLNDPVSGLRIGGWEKLSMVDWPGRLCAVLFLQGCAWRCRYCHNPHLIPFGVGGAESWGEFLRWLHRRRGLLDGVVFSGGEPTWQSGLGEAMDAVLDLGFQIGLHTGGPSPRRLSALLPRVSWAGFDFKAPFDRYAQVTGVNGGEAARESLGLIQAAGVACEVRSTWHPRLITADELEMMADALAAAGVSSWVIQRFRPEGCTDAELRAHPLGAVPLGRLERPGLTITVR